MKTQSLYGCPVSLEGAAEEEKYLKQNPSEAPTFKLTYLQRHLREVVKVRSVVNGFDLDRSSGRPLPDVTPVNTLEPVQSLQVRDTANSLLSLATEPATPPQS